MAARLSQRFEMQEHQPLPSPANHRHEHCHNPCHDHSGIPTLLDILNDNIDPESAYSKINFLKFLVDKHCIENYEFFTELMSILKNYDAFKRYNSTSEWFSLYTQYIGTETINLPADLVLHLSKTNLPCLRVLKKVEKIVASYLLSSYYEFISSAKGASTGYYAAASSRPQPTQSPAHDGARNNSSEVSSRAESICSGCSFDIYKLNQSLRRDTLSTFEHDVFASSSDEEARNDCAAGVPNDKSAKGAHGQTGPEDASESTLAAPESNVPPGTRSRAIPIRGASQNSTKGSTVISNSSSGSSGSLSTVGDARDAKPVTSSREPKSWSKLTNKLKWKRKTSQ